MANTETDMAVANVERLADRLRFWQQAVVQEMSYLKGLTKAIDPLIALYAKTQITIWKASGGSDYGNVMSVESCITSAEDFGSRFVEDQRTFTQLDAYLALLKFYAQQLKEFYNAYNQAERLVKEEPDQGKRLRYMFGSDFSKVS